MIGGSLVVSRTLDRGVAGFNPSNCAVDCVTGLFSCRPQVTNQLGVNIL